MSAAQVNAAPLLDDKFDTYADQTALNAAWPGTTGSSAATLWTAQKYSGTQSVNIGLAASQRSARSFTDTIVPLGSEMIWSFRYYDSDSSAAAYRNYAELLDGPGSSSFQIIAMGLNNNIASNKYMARVLGADGGAGVSAFFQLNGTGSPNRSTGWHELKAVYTRLTTTTAELDFYVDGILSKADIPVTTIRGYDSVRIGSNVSSSKEAGYNDMLVDVGVVPEPAAISVLGLAAAGMLLRRRRA